MAKWWAARSKRTQAILVLVGLFVLYAIVGPKAPAGTTAVGTTTPSETLAAAGTTSPPAGAQTATPTLAPTVAPTPTPRPAPTAFNFGDGTYMVPSQIAAGTYRTRDRQPGTCYWARLSGFSGASNELLANDLSSDPTVVTIVPTDKGFQSRGCARFSADISAITKAPTDPLPPGTYIVGVDVAPGTWSATPPAGSTCYWARLAGFTGGSGDLVANDLGRAPTIATIVATDKGFKSSGCGIWTKSG